MSITYDSEKFTSPLKAVDIEQPRQLTISPVVVSLRDFRYFKVQQDMSGDEIEVYLSGGNQSKDKAESA